MSARMTASPSNDMEIRKALRPLGGDGVISSSLRTRASPSKDREMRREGGDLAFASCTSDVDRLRLELSGVCPGSCAVVWELNAGSSTSVAIVWLDASGPGSSISVAICELNASGPGSSSVAIVWLDSGWNVSDGRSSSSGSGASSLLGSNATRGARSSWGWRGLDFRRSFWRRFWNHIYIISHVFAMP